MGLTDRVPKGRGKTQEPCPGRLFSSCSSLGCWLCLPAYPVGVCGSHVRCAACARGTVFPVLFSSPRWLELDRCSLQAAGGLAPLPFFLVPPQKLTVGRCMHPLLVAPTAPWEGHAHLFRTSGVPCLIKVLAGLCLAEKAGRGQGTSARVPLIGAKPHDDRPTWLGQTESMEIGCLPSR